MTRKVTRQEFLRLGALAGAVVASGGALGALDTTGALAADEDDRRRSPLSPRPGAHGVSADAVLAITFDAPPTVGTSGLVRVVRSSDGTVVDTIDLAATAQTRT